MIRPAVDDADVIIGDLNSYDLEDPIDVLKAAGYPDLIAEFNGPEAYSYVFDGQVGYLDHAMADADCYRWSPVRRLAHQRRRTRPDRLRHDVQAAAQDLLYEPNPYRSSDHDPVVVGLDLCDSEAPTLSVGLDTTSLWPPDHTLRPVEATVSAGDNSGIVSVELVSVTSDEPDNGADDGDTVGDIVVVDDTHFELRAERSGLGDGRTYTVTYEATDGCGNTTVATATVDVPLRPPPGRN